MADPLHQTTHAELCVLAKRWLVSKGCGVVFGDNFRALTHSAEQPDAIGWRWDASILIECKTSRADFLADKRKHFRSDDRGVGDWRFYLCSPGTIGIPDLPAGWGLLLAKGSRVHRIHGIPEHWRHDKPFVGHKEIEGQMLYAALRRIEIRTGLALAHEPLADEDGLQTAA